MPPGAQDGTYMHGNMWDPGGSGAAGMDPVVLKRLSLAVLEIRVGAFRRVLTGVPAVDVNLLQIELKRDVSVGRVQAKLLQTPLDKMDSLKRQMQYLQAADTLRLK